jgi:hypothetical protein
VLDETAESLFGRFVSFDSFEILVSNGGTYTHKLLDLALLHALLKSALLGG